MPQAKKRKFAGLPKPWRGAKMRRDIDRMRLRADETEDERAVRLEIRDLKRQRPRRERYKEFRVRARQAAEQRARRAAQSRARRAAAAAAAASST